VEDATQGAVAPDTLVSRDPAMSRDAVPAWLLASRPTGEASPRAAASAPSARPGRRTRRLFADRLLATLAAWVERTLASDELARRPGLLQRLDPRVKLVTLLAFIVVAALSTRLSVLLVLLAFAVALVPASRLGLIRFGARAWLFIPLFTAAIMLPATLNIVTPGRAMLTFWSHGAPFSLLPATLAVTAPGLFAFVRLVLRVTTVVSFGVLLTLTTPWSDLLKAMRAVGVPRGFVFVLAVAYRYVFTLVRLVQDMALARKSRLVGRVAAGEDHRFLGATVATVFGKSQATSEQVYLAMISRGYSGETRTLRTWRLGPLDVVWAAGVAAGLGALVWFAFAAGTR
jgi:cobalt/nickel transport system permease protein